MGEHLYNMLNDDYFDCEEDVVKIRRADCCAYCDHSEQRCFGSSDYWCSKHGRSVYNTDVCKYYEY